MPLATLEFTDFAIIGALFIVFAGVGAAAAASFRPADRERLTRIERKLDLILTSLGVEYTPPAAQRWQALSDQGQKIAAIKAYRAEHGCGLADAKQAVEEYIRTRA